MPRTHRIRAFMIIAVLGHALMTGSFATACGLHDDLTSPINIFDPEEEIARVTVAALRAAGPAGLDRLLEAHREMIAVVSKSNWSTQDATVQSQWDQLRRAIDAVGAAKDNHVACLYWYTDFEQAREAAKKSNRPILSLRLLGRLDEDLSCANSRFFRTALYANGEVSKWLREYFVLHWQSVRPVPQITIDFGDGRVLKRTITGNSIHYILDSEGQPIDAIPGLYGPQSFLRQLGDGLRLFRALQLAADAPSRQELLMQHHDRMAGVIKGRWLSHLQSIGAMTQEDAIAAVNLSAFAEQPLWADERVRAEAVPAMLAAPVAMTKAGIERPTLAAMGLDAGVLLEHTNDEIWQQIAVMYESANVLDASSIALLRHKTSQAAIASQITFTKRLEEDPLMRVIERFQRSLAIDTVRNEFMLHRQIHEWFAAGEVALLSVDAINSRVYAELFLTPDSDPWLGLVPPETYAALDGGGLLCR